MNYSILKTILLFGVLGFFIGCSGDRAQLISHPTAAKPGDTIPVVFTDLYVIVSDTSVIRNGSGYTRDSLHAVYGLPAGWKVLSSGFYVASGIQVNSLLNITTDTTLLAKLIQDSLAAYMAKQSPMAPDTTWKKYFVKKTLTAHGFALDSISVITDNVPQWLSYAGKIGFNFPAGTKMDTSIAVSSLPIDTNSIPAIAKFLFGNIKTIWFKTVPTVCFARLLVGSVEDTFNLYYYTKTGGFPGTGSVSLFSAYDKGDLTYATIDINKMNAVKQLPFRNQARSLLSVYPGPGSTTRIMIGAQAQGELSICDIAGKTVRRFGTINNTSAIVWDQTTSAGARVNAGVYVVRLQTQKQCASQAVRVVR